MAQLRRALYRQCKPAMSSILNGKNELSKNLEHAGIVDYLEGITTAREKLYNIFMQLQTIDQQQTTVQTFDHEKKTRR